MEVSIKVKFKPLFWVKYTLVRVTKNMKLLQRFIDDVAANPKRYYRVKTLRDRPPEHKSVGQYFKVDRSR